MGRQLASFDGISYTYNEDGIRTSKTSNGVTTKYYLDGTDVIEQTDGTTTIHFYYDSRDELIGFNYADNDYIYVKNQQGDVTDITNSNGEVVASYAYDPWGKVIGVSGANLELANLNPFRYRSYYYDSDIQMYYLQSRYYDPEVSRFINCDDVNYIGNTESELSYNAFAYCENEPVSMKDPSGYSINVSVRYFDNVYVGKNSMNQYVFAFQYLKYGFNYDYSDSSELGKSYFLAIVIVWNRTYIKLNVCFESSDNNKGIAANKKYICAFVAENLCYDLAEYAMQCYKNIYSKKYARRSAKGIEFEILLHIYMYYFSIDKNYKSSREIDIDNNRDGLIIEVATTSSLINRCKKALKNKKEDKLISNILKTVFKITRKG